MTAPRRRRGSAPIAADGDSDSRRSPRRRPLPFGVHQLLEYLVAGALLELSLHSARSGLLVGGAAAFALLALTARGPLGVVRVCGRRLHAAVEIVVALALAAAPILPALRPDALAIVALEVVALFWLRVVTLTRYATPPRAVADRADRQPQRAPSEDRDAPRPATSDVARTLGLFAGRAARRLPETRADLAEQARQAADRANRIHRAVRNRTRP